MSLQLKTLLFLGALTTIGMLVLISLASWFLLRGFAIQEGHDTSIHIQRAQSSISDELDFLEATADDWASWDDTYDFIQNKDQDYIDTNLVGDTFDTLSLDLAIYFDKDDKAVVTCLYDFKEQAFAPLPDEILHHLTEVLKEKNDKETTTGGIVMLRDGPMLAVFSPIMTSTSEGPSRGTLVFGRYMDEVWVSKLASKLILNLEVETVIDGVLPEDLPVNPLVILGEGSIAVQPLDSATIAGYAVLNDISGQPALVLKVIQTRSIMESGRKTVMLMVACQLALSLALVGAALLLLQNILLSRLSRLGTAVSTVASKHDLSVRVPDMGGDELGKLATGFNGMLESLSEARSKRLEAEKQIIAQKALTDRVLASVPSPLLVVNRGLHIVMYNQAFIDTFKLKTPPHDSSLSETLKIEGVENAVKSVFETKQPKPDFEVRYKLEGTEEKIIITSVLPIPMTTVDPEEDLAMVSLRDVTLERQALERIHHNESLVALGQMAAGIAHELNNPLTSILGYTKLLMREKVSEDAKQDLDTIALNAQRASVTVKSLLDFAAPQEPIRHPIDINDSIKRSLSVLRYQLERDKIEVISELAQDLPKTMADPRQIEQVFMNIILNASNAIVGYSKNGTLIINTTSEKNRIRIRFTDNGPGIPQENLVKIFEPFFTTKEPGKGTGLGLSISYSIIREHGGRMWAESVEGKGATFIIELPSTSPEPASREEP